jgi:hypothetical protein
MTELMGPKMPFQNGLPKRVQWWASSKHPQKQVRPPVGDQDGKAEAGEEAAHASNSTPAGTSLAPMGDGVSR